MGIELTGKIISRLAFHKIIITQYCTHGHEIIMWRYLRRTDDYLKGKRAGDWLKSLGPYQVSSVLIHLSLKCCLFPKFPPIIFHLPNVPLQVQEKMFVAAEKWLQEWSLDRGQTALHIIMFAIFIQCIWHAGDICMNRWQQTCAKNIFTSVQSLNGADWPQCESTHWLVLDFEVV